MLGHRGCRLGISYPEIYEMQARAIFEGALEVAKETGKAPVPEIMIPLVGVRKELQHHLGRLQFLLYLGQTMRQIDLPIRHSRKRDLHAVVS